MDKIAEVDDVAENAELDRFLTCPLFGQEAVSMNLGYNEDKDTVERIAPRVTKGKFKLSRRYTRDIPNWPKRAKHDTF